MYKKLCILKMLMGCKGKSNLCRMEKEEIKKWNPWVINVFLFSSGFQNIIWLLNVYLLGDFFYYTYFVFLFEHIEQKAKFFIQNNVLKIIFSIEFFQGLFLLFPKYHISNILFIHFLFSFIINSEIYSRGKCEVFQKYLGKYIQFQHFGVLYIRYT